LPSPPEIERARDQVIGKLLTNPRDAIVGAQAVTRRHGSQFAWQLYQAVLTSEAREALLKRWMAPRQRAARMAAEAGWGELVIQQAEKGT